MVCYAPAQRCVAGGILFLSCSSVRPCVRPKTLLTRYLAEYLTYFTKLTATMHYGTEMNASQFGVKGQGHGGITYAGTITEQAET